MSKPTDTKWTTPLPYTKGLPATVGDKGQRMFTFQEPIEMPFTPTSHRLIITVGTGGAREMLQLAEPRMRAYAKRLGADFIALTNRTQSWPLAEKFRIGHYARRYDRVLFLDADVFVRESAPDIFDTVPAGAIGFYNDMPDLEDLGGPVHGTAWLDAELRMLSESQGAPVPRGCLNTGVVVFDGKDADIWNAPEKPFPMTHCMEQHWVQSQAMAKGRLFSLPVEFNWQFWSHLDLHGVEDAHFVHLSGIGERCPEMALPMMRALCLR